MGELVIVFNEKPILLNIIKAFIVNGRTVFMNMELICENYFCEAKKKISLVKMFGLLIKIKVSFQKS